MKKYYVYKHTNKTNGKVYIGITGQQPEDRWKYGYGYQSQQIFWRAIQKYSWDGFTHEILFSGLTKEEAKRKEVELIALYKSNCTRYNSPSYGYNATDGGDTINEEALCKKIWQYDLQGNFIKEWDSTAEASAELEINSSCISHCINGKGARAGQYMWLLATEEKPEVQIENYFAKRGIRNPEEKKEIGKKVCQYDLSGKYIKTWETMLEAEMALGSPVSAAGICGCCKEKKPTCGGYRWCYWTEEAEKDIQSKVVHKNAKAINQYDESGKLVNTWLGGASEASRETEISRKAINNYIRGNTKKKPGGYHWEYAERV